MKKTKKKGPSCQYGDGNCHKKAVVKGLTLRYCQKHANWYVRHNPGVKVTRIVSSSWRGRY